LIWALPFLALLGLYFGSRWYRRRRIYEAVLYSLSNDARLNEVIRQINGTRGGRKYG